MVNAILTSADTTLHISFQRLIANLNGVETFDPHTIMQACRQRLVLSIVIDEVLVDLHHSTNHCYLDRF
jgi:hypothetical protein